MRWFWIPCFFSVLGWAAEPDPMPTPGDSSAGPRPLAAAHYELLMEYSPFVKSLESAKVTEKSPDLVVVGYGRFKGEDYVIVQKKEESDKRAKIGPRFGSKDFPYRLVSVTNKTNRKDFMAVLEDNQKRQVKVRYGEASSAPPPATVTGAAITSQAGGSPQATALSSNQTNLPGVQNQNPVDKIQTQLRNLEIAMNDPTKEEKAREAAAKKYGEILQQLEGLKSPDEKTTQTISPAPE